MEKFSLFLERKLLPIGEKINRIRFLQIVRMSMMPIIPLIMAGSFVLIILSFPYLNEVIPSEILTVAYAIFSPLITATFNLIALFLAFLVGYNYSSQEDERCNNVYVGLTTLAAFFIISPTGVVSGETVVAAIPTQFMGAQGMFVALIFSYIVAIICCKFMKSNFKIKLPDNVPEMVSASFESLIPIVITLVFASIVQYGFTLTSYENIHQMISSVIQQPLTAIGTSLSAIVFTQGLAQVFWFFGLHGDQIINPVINPILVAANMENLAAFTQGTDLPYIITESFRGVFVQSGFISLAIAIIIATRSKRYRKVGKLMTLPTVFGVSEPTVFATPVVMNFALFIPWVLVRPVFAIITYMFMSTGICPPPTGVDIPWTVPPLISGFLTTNSIMGALVQLICLTVGVIMFIPFVRVMDKTAISQEEEVEGLD
ncbi:MAG: PTS sugar transporter subunit IIC [Breznakia sp.]